MTQDREASESTMAALWSGGVNVGARGHDAGNLSFLFRDESTWFSRLRFK